MDFDSIEGLNNEDLKGLYENRIIDFDDSIFLSTYCLHRVYCITYNRTVYQGCVCCSYGYSKGPYTRTSSGDCVGSPSSCPNGSQIYQFAEYCT